MATVFENVRLAPVQENVSIASLNKQEERVRIEISSEDGSAEIAMLIVNGQSPKSITLSDDLECAKIAPNVTSLFTDSQSYLLKFASEPDRKRFQKTVQDALKSKKDSAFNSRTEEASAEQYFQFYGYLSQQQNMMQDYIRTSTYQRAMLNNTIDFTDKVVLDVGAGSGILSFFAVQAGARKVYAIEASSMARHCEMLVGHNKLSDFIKVIPGKIEEVDLPEMVDVIISEPMGYMLFNERMLETYLHAKKWLKPDGKMFPTQGDLHICPFTDDSLYMEQFSKANFWYQPSFHGVDLCSLRQAAVVEYFKQPVVDTFDIRICMSRSHKFTIDFQSAHESDLHNIEIPVSYTMLQTGTVHGLAFWFDVAFIGSQSTVWLSTAPTQPLTHWYQVRCLLQNPVFVKQGQTLKGRVVLQSNKRQSYDVDIELYIPGTGTKSTNTLDLKNPFFRYTGQPTCAPPGTLTQSPSDAYWGSQQYGAMDQTGAYEVATILNGGGDPSQHMLQQQSGVAHSNLVPLANVAPVNPGSIPAATVVSSGSNNAIANMSIQNRTSVGGGIAPNVFSSQQLTTMSGQAQSFGLSNQLLIGDYMVPGNIALLPTQTLGTQARN